MSVRLLIGLCVMTLAGCIDEPAPKDAQKAAVSMEQDAIEKSIQQDQLSIEDAADKAVKLIEEDATAEIDAANAEQGKATP